jgi:hypothetical protein
VLLKVCAENVKGTEWEEVLYPVVSLADQRMLKEFRKACDRDMIKREIDPYEPEDIA